LNNKINLFVALGPVVKLDYSHFTLKLFAQRWIEIAEIAKRLDMYELPPCSYVYASYVCPEYKEYSPKNDKIPFDID